MLDCVGSLTGAVEGSQIANFLGIVSAYRVYEYDTIAFITDEKRL
jgi:hypothetical protein